MLHSGWQLFGAPDASTTAGVRETLTENQCELYTFGGGASRLVEPGVFESERGYWLFCPNDAVIQVADAPVNQNSIYISLNKGWNVVTVPGGRTLRPDASLRVGGRRLADTTDIRHEFYEYDPALQKYVRATSLQPWRAYFVFANAATNLEFMAGSGQAGEDTLPDVAPFTEDTSVVTPPDGPAYVAGQLLISFGPAPPAGAEAALRAAGLEPVGFDPDTGVYQARVLPGTDADRARDTLTSNGATISRNYILSIERTPDDAVFTSAPAPGAAWAYNAVNLPAVWGAYTPVASPIVAVVDTGVDATHPDLAGRVVAGANFIAGGSGTDTSDQNGHGTQVAGVIAAQGDNQTAIAGMCPGCRILPVKVCDATGRCPLYSVLNGIGYAASLRVPVVNISLGAAFPDDASARALFENALAAANTSGAIVVAAAGNKNADAADYLPAAIPQVISVGAVDKNFQRAPFSNFGGTVDLAAPGADVYTTTTGGGMKPVSGTSVSAAFVSGLAAQMLAVYPEAPAAEVRNVLTTTANPLSADRPIGAGLIDAEAAMRIARERLLGPSGGNDPPRILSMAADPPAGAPATVFTLAVQAEDPDGDTLRYAWTAPAGTLSNPDAPLTTWDAAGLPAGDYTFFVSVSDDNGASAMDVVTVKIQIAAGDTLDIYPPVAVTTLDAPFTFTARLRRADGSLTAVSAQWSIDDPTVGAMDASGVFHPAAQGETDITAAMPDGSTARARIRAYDPLLNPLGRERAIEVPPELDAMGIASGGSWSWSENSEFMVGSVMVKVVFIESDGSIDANTFNWTPAEISTAYDEIKTGLQWWTTLDSRANLSFNVLPYEVFNTGYEPTLHDSMSDQAFINQYLFSKGYTTDYGFPLLNKINRNMRFNDDLRTTYSTEWAFTIYVVTGNPTYTDGFCGYAYMGGPYVMMTRDNNGWGLNNMDKVTAHETGHIFNAGDQYSGSCNNCTDQYGYLDIPNSNCYVCPSTFSIMKNASWFADTSARQQVGWRDSDGDNVLDPVDPDWGGSSSFNLSPPAATVTSGTAVDLTATLFNYKGDTIPGATVTFTTTAGSVSPTPVRTGLPGTALTTLATQCTTHTVTAATPGTGNDQSILTGTCVAATEPQNVTAAVSCPDITITWTPGSDPSYDRYTVKRATTSGGPYNEIATNISTTSYTDPNVPNGTYYYVIIANKSTNPANQTIPSNEAMASPTCVTTPPSGVAATVNCPNVNLTWNAASPAAYNRYTVKRAIISGGPYTQIGTGISTTSYSDPNPGNGTYYYIVIAYKSTDPADQTGASAEASASVSCGSGTGGVAMPCNETWPMVNCNEAHDGRSAQTLPLPLALKWTFQTGDMIYGSSPIVANGKIFVGSTDHKLYALDKNTGTKIWEFDTGSDIKTTPLYYQGKVYICPFDEFLYALDENTGNLIWKQNVFSCGSDVSPTVYDGMIYIGWHYSLNPETGAVIWKAPIPHIDYGETTFTIVGDKFFRGNMEGMVARNRFDGSSVWDFDAVGPGTYVYGGTPAAGHGNVYFGVQSQAVYALDQNTGILKWSFSTTGNSKPTPSVGNGRVFVNSPSFTWSYLYALDVNTGAELWSKPFGSNSSSTIVDGKLVIPSSFGVLYVLDETTGNTLWSYLLGGEVFRQSPPVVDGMVFVGATDGKVYAFETTVAIPPSNLTATANCPDVDLTWTAAAPAAYDRYTVKRGTVSGGPYTEIATGITTTSYTDPNPGNGTYYYIVIAYKSTNPADQTGASNEASVTLNCGTTNGTPCDTEWPYFMCNIYNTGESNSTVTLPLSKKWEFPSGGEIWSSPVVSSNRVFFGSNDQSFYALNASTGAKLWQFFTGGVVSGSGAISNGRVIFGSRDFKVYSLDETTGVKIWDFTTGADVTSSPAVSGNRVFIGSTDHKVYALDETTGAKLWEFTTGFDITATPAVADGKVFIGSQDDKLYALNESTGAKLWEFTTGGYVTGSATVANGRVYFGSYDFKVYALNENTGAKEWEFTTGDQVRSTPAVSNGVVYVGSYDDKVYALNETTGVKIWEYTTGDNIYSSPVVANGKVFVPSIDNKIYALDITNGNKLWEYTTGGGISSIPAIASGTVYAGSYDNVLYAFEYAPNTPPANVYATVACPDVEIHWDAAQPAEYNRYTVKRGTTSGGPYTEIATGISALTYTDPNPGNGTYYYIVIAYKSTNPADQTNPSNEAAAAVNCGTPTTNGTPCDTTWPSYRCNLHNSAESVTTVNLPLQIKWEFQAGSTVQSTAAVMDGKVFITSDTEGKVFALDKNTGTQIWEFPTNNWLLNSPAVENGTVYIAGLSKTYALDADTGAIIWEKLSNTGHGSPAVHNGRLFHEAYGDRVIARDTSNGNQLWSFITGNDVDSSPAVADGMVFFGCGNQKIYALDEITGAKIWEFAAGGAIQSSPAVADGKVFFGSTDDKVYAVDEITGIKLWEFTTGWTVVSSPTVYDGKVFIGSLDNKLYALNENTGVKIWDAVVPGSISGSPIVVDGKVFVGEAFGDYTYAFDINTGTKLWEYATGGHNDISPSAAEGVLYIGDMNGKMVAFESAATPPSNLTATANCPDVDLAWTAAAPAEYDRYTVKRATASGGPYTEIATGITTTSYTDPNPGNGTYYYIVIAYKNTNPADQTAASNEASVTLNCGTNVTPTPCTTNWPTYMCNAQNTGAADSTAVPPYALKWESNVSAGGTYCSVAVDNDVAYTCDNNGKLFAFDAITGATIWTYAGGDMFYDKSPTVANGMVYIGNTGGEFFAFDKTNGAVVWQKTGIGMMEGATAIADAQYVYVGAGTYVYAFDAYTGTQLWRVTPPGVSNIGDSTASLYNGYLYIASKNANSKVYRLRTTDGATVWQGPLATQIRGSSPTLSGNKVFYGTYDSKLIALNIDTGAQIWEAPLTGVPSDSTPAVADNRVHINDSAGYTYAFDVDTGNQIWKVSTNAGSTSGVPAVTVANGRVYTGIYNINPISKYLTVLKADTGAVEWTYSLGTLNSYSAPAIVNNRIYFTAGAKAICLESSTTVTPPSNLTATANCPDVDLAWTAAAPAAYDRYTVKRGTTSGGPYTEIATGITTTSYTDPNPGNGTYYYIVIAYKSANPADQTGASNEASVTLNCGSTTNGTACDTNWPKFHCNNHNTGEGNTTISLPLSKKWEFTTGGQVNEGVSVANGIVYAASKDGKVYALNQDTGAKLWEFIAGTLVAGTPAVADGRVFFGSQIGKFYAADAITGVKLWEFNTVHPWNWSAPAVASDTVFFTGWDKMIHALNVATGVEKWNYTFGDFSFSSPAIADGMVFAGSGDHKLYAFNETTGAKIWEYTTGDSVQTSPTVANGMVYFGSYDDKLYALDELTGNKIWEFTTGGNIASSPSVANGKVIFGSSDFKMYALDSGTGAKIWETVLGDHIYPSPAVVNGMVFVGSHNNKIYILDETTGVILWEYLTGDDVTSSPAVVDGVLYIGSRDFKVYAFEYQPTTPPSATATLNCPDVDLTWSAAAPASFDRYTVYRADASGGPYTQIATNISATSYTDSMPGEGLYYYVIEAYESANPANTTGYSNEVYAEVGCDVTLNVTGTCNPMLSWDAAPAPLDRYTVSRSGAPGGPYTDIATNLSVTDYIDATALDNTTYYYTVTPYRSTNPAKKADPSNEVSLTTDCAPWDLTGEMHCPEIALIWQPSNGLQYDRYTVLRGGVSGGPYTQIATGLTTTGYTDAPPSAGQTYYYVIQAYENANPANKTGYSNEIMIADFTCPYPKPQNLTATLNCPDIDLTWDPVATASGYNVYRATTSGGPYTRIDEGVTSPYTDTTTVAGTTYYYVVTAFFSGQAGEESDYSNEAGLTNSCAGVTIPKPPHPVAATAITGGITLDWTAPTQNTDNSPLTDLAGYKVYRSTVSGGPYTYQQSLGLTLTHTDTSVAVGTTYCYVLTAFDSEIPSNESAYSMEVCEEPLGSKPYTYDFDCGNNIPPHFSAPTPAGELYRPFEVTTDAAGNFYVANTLNNRIEKYDASCNFVRKWGSAGGLPGYMTEPRGIVYNPATGLIYVTDEYERVQAFTTDGVYQSGYYSQLAKSLGVDAAGNLYVASDRNGGTLFKRDASGAVLAEWPAPGIKGVAVSGAGEIFIISGNSVKQLDNTGAVVASFSGTLAAPAGIHISPDGRLFISDITLKKVEIYAKDGTYIDSVGNGGLAPGEFSEPTDVWVISNDMILVLDHTHDRISRFSQK